jgi:hypothetical protein
VAELSAACRAVDEDLSALLDAELSPQREAEVRAHLEACDRCTRRLEQLCDVDLTLASLPAPELPADLEARLMQRLAGPAPRPTRARGPRRVPPRLRRAWGLGAAGAAAAAGLAAYLLLRVPDPPAPEPLAQRPEAPPAGAESPPALAQQAAPGDGAPPVPGSAAAEAAPRVAVEPEPLAPEASLEGLEDEELALLLELDAVEDLDVIANLELLERFLTLEPREGSG